VQTSSVINLESLLDLSARLNESDDKLYILNAILLSLMGKLRIMRAAALEPSADGTEFCVVTAKGKAAFEKLPCFDVEKVREIVEEDSESEKLLKSSGYRFCLPVRYQQKLLAIICLGEKLGNSPLTDEEFHYASLVCIVSGNALQHAETMISLQEEKATVEKRNQLLTTIFEMNREFSTLLTRDQIIKMLSYRLMGQLMVSRFALFLNGSDNEFETVVNRLGAEPDKETLKSFSKLRDIEFAEKCDVCDSAKEFLKSTKVEVLSPMKVHGNSCGIMAVGKKLHGGAFKKEDLQFIEALGNTAIAALENARLFQEEVEKKKLEAQMSLAKDIQKGLLPKELPVLKGFEISCHNISSFEVGGDYYDVIELSKDEILFAIADVSGKGIPAALLMANVQAALRTLAPLKLELCELVSRINSIVFQNTTSDKFVTFFCGILNCTLKTFKYVNAGHNPPYLLKSDRTIHELSEGGLILGILDAGIPYATGEIQLDEQDVIVLFTDGVNEAMSGDNTEFGDDALKNVMQEQAFKNADEISQEVLKAVEAHVAGAPQSDDITLMVLKSVIQ
jgi:sigma-B regulation protein RsbU (phosphoserine phosphatase)